MHHGLKDECFRVDWHIWSRLTTHLVMVKVEMREEEIFRKQIWQRIMIGGSSFSLSLRNKHESVVCCSLLCLCIFAECIFLLFFFSCQSTWPQSGQRTNIIWQNWNQIVYECIFAIIFILWLFNSAIIDHLPDVRYLWVFRNTVLNNLAMGKRWQCHWGIVTCSYTHICKQKPPAPTELMD
jgi:hypothetical protein